MASSPSWIILLAFQAILQISVQQTIFKGDHLRCNDIQTCESGDNFICDANSVCEIQCDFGCNGLVINAKSANSLTITNCTNCNDIILYCPRNQNGDVRQCSLEIANDVSNIDIFSQKSFFNFQFVPFSPHTNYEVLSSTMHCGDLSLVEFTCNINENGTACNEQHSQCQYGDNLSIYPSIAPTNTAINTTATTLSSSSTDLSVDELDTNLNQNQNGNTSDVFADNFHYIVLIMGLSIIWSSFFCCFIIVYYHRERRRKHKKHKKRSSKSKNSKSDKHSKKHSNSASSHSQSHTNSRSRSSRSRSRDRSRSHRQKTSNSHSSPSSHSTSIQKLKPEKEHYEMNRLFPVSSMSNHTLVYNPASNQMMVDMVPVPSLSSHYQLSPNHYQVSPHNYPFFAAHCSPRYPPPAYAVPPQQLANSSKKNKKKVHKVHKKKCPHNGGNNNDHSNVYYKSSIVRPPSPENSESADLPTSLVNASIDPLCNSSDHENDYKNEELISKAINDEESDNDNGNDIGNVNVIEHQNDNNDNNDDGDNNIVCIRLGKYKVDDKAKESDDDEKEEEINRHDEGSFDSQYYRIPNIDEQSNDSNDENEIEEVAEVKEAKESEMELKEGDAPSPSPPPIVFNKNESEALNPGGILSPSRHFRVKYSLGIQNDIENCMSGPGENPKRKSFTFEESKDSQIEYLKKPSMPMSEIGENDRELQLKVRVPQNKHVKNEPIALKPISN